MILAAKAVTLQYGKKKILEQTDLSVDRPEIISIIGPNGSGKSTLLKALGRLLKPTCGVVMLAGENINSLKSDIVARKMALLPQTTGAPGDMTVADLVAYGRMPYQKLWQESTSKADQTAIEEAMRATGITSMKYRRISTLSGGERQRTWLAMALAQEPEILLLDEPTTYLDIHHQLELMMLVERLQKELNITVIMVMHELNHAARFSNRLVAVKNGKIIADGSVETVFTSENIKMLYGIDNSVLKIKENGVEHLVCLPHGISSEAGA